MSIRNGIPPPASFSNIIFDLFQNQENEFNGLKTIVTFSKVSLTDDQKSQLTYSQFFEPLDFYIIYQTDIYNGSELISTKLELVSFIKLGNYIYGAYFDVFAQPRFEIDYLKSSKEPVNLLPTVRFITSQYLELYNCVLGITIILGLNTSDSTSSLQYSHNCKYFSEDLSIYGIDVSHLGPTILTGLSTNLHYPKIYEEPLTKL
jgi:hypothetical protein